LKPFRRKGLPVSRIDENDKFLKISSLLQRYGLPNSAQRVLARLCYHRNTATGQCNPRIATIAEFLCFTERTVYYAIRLLKEIGLVSGRGTGHKVESYTIAPETEWERILKRAVKLKCSSVSQTETHFNFKLNSISISNCNGFQKGGGLSINEKKKGKEEGKRGESNRTFTSTTTSGESSAGTAPPSPHFASQNGHPKQTLAVRDEESEMAWETVARVFDGCGRPLAAKDTKRARALFFGYTPDERQEIARDACVRARELWNEPRWTPQPLAYLRSHDWRDRPLKERTLPVKRKASVQEEILRANYERACERDRRQQR